VGTETEKILGTIGAMETFIENFPMNILDSKKPTNLKCAFDFILKILAICGVDINEIIERILEKVFDVRTTIEGGIESVYQTIMELDINEQSKFMEGIEYAVKGVLMSLLTSIFSCSVIPILPDKYFDTSKEDNRFDAFRDYIKNYPDKLRFTTDSLDLFGMLDVNPFSKEGQLYYRIENNDLFFGKKEYVESKTIDVSAGYEEKSMQTCSLYIDFGESHEEYVEQTFVMTQSGDTSEYVTDSLLFRLTKPVYEDLNIEIVYFIDGPSTSSQPGLQTMTVTIPKGETQSESFSLSPFTYGYESPNGYRDSIFDFVLSSTISLVDGWELTDGENYVPCTQKECIAGEDFVFLDYEKSLPVINFWLSRNNASMSQTFLTNRAYEIDTPEIRREITEEITVTASTYQYERLDGRPDVDDNEIQRYNAIPTSATTNSPEYIVIHNGIDESTLYKTNDMNAFLWYVLHKSRPTTQTEKNKSMWDSRNSAKRIGIERNSPRLWNVWYNSKKTDEEEFKFFSNDDQEIPFNNKEEQNKTLYPILQCNRMYPSSNGLMVEIPAQKYFKPKAQASDNTNIYNLIRTNSTIYEFNWQYLDNIQIFKPKLILFGMFDALLNGAISLAMSVKPNFKKEETKAKLSKAIIKYIEAVDTETEDCFFTFSNDEFNDMLEDMLLSKFNATFTPGPNKTIKQHNITEYFNSIDKINPSSEQGGSVQSIMKTITDVSATNAQDGVIDYGLTLEYDDSWWKAIIQSLAMSLIESILTPQVILLILINFRMMGITSSEDFLVPDQNKIIALVINKILGIIKSIINLIKDKILEILLELVYEKLIPMITKYMVVISLEKIQMWIDLLTDTLNCLMTINIGSNRVLTQIDDVNYADIVKPITLPESILEC